MFSWDFIRQVGLLAWVVRYSSLQFRKRILRTDSYQRLPTGIRIQLPRQSMTSTEIYVTKADIDWGAEKLFTQFADKSRDFLDVGSHIGYYAAYLSPRVRRVYAFEPNQSNIAGLSKNAALASNIEIIQKAVSSKDGIAEFFSGGDSSKGSLNHVGGSREKVDVTTIDTFVAEHPGIDVGLVKIDIEGHDFAALLGMEATVAGYQPLILTECEFSEDLSALCGRWKYRIFAFVRNRETQRTHRQEMCFPHDRNLWYKMLFLVPPQLQPTFHALSVQNDHIAA